MKDILTEGITSTRTKDIRGQNGELEQKGECNAPNPKSIIMKGIKFHVNYFVPNLLVIDIKIRKAGEYLEVSGSNRF